MFLLLFIDPRLLVVLFKGALSDIGVVSYYSTSGYYYSLCVLRNDFKWISSVIVLDREVNKGLVYD